MEEARVYINQAALVEQEIHQHEMIIQRLTSENQELSTALKYERELREKAEKRIADLEQNLSELRKAKGKRRTKAEVEALRATEAEYSEFKSDGVRKKQKTVSIKSYDDFKKIDNYFREKKEIRNSMLWTIGICLGVRASDLCSLKWKNVLNEDFTFKERVMMYEKKTSKLQNCLITEAIIKSLTEYLNSIRWNFELENPIFLNIETGKPITEKHCWRILKEAAKAVGIDYNIGSHSMRQSFANIAMCADKTAIDMNAITKVQGLLNHSDPRVTMRYLGTLDKMYDVARKCVSDFVLGKTEVNELVAGNTNNLSDIFEKLLEIEEKLS